MSSDFAAATRDLGLSLDARALQRFEHYRDRLAGASRQFNLTTVRDPKAIEVRHLLESLALAQTLERQGLLTDGARVLDMGSGAGLPGIPFQVAYPALKVTLLESLTKRCVFLRQMVEELGLEQATVLDGRAEDYGREERYREAFDLVVARAVAPIPVLIEYALPFLREGGTLAATKGSATLREIEASGPALEELGGEHVQTLRLDPPGGMAQSVVLIRKVVATPARYPRRPGIPSKRPIA